MGIGRSFFGLEGRQSGAESRKRVGLVLEQGILATVANIQWWLVG
jgi:hypothetical protein